jgi:hypothetical protein
MRLLLWATVVVAAGALALAGCQRSGGPVAVDAARLTAADKEPGNWMSQGRTYSEQRFSPLDKINVGHGFNAISGGVIPDLRYSPLIGPEQAFDGVVLGGALKDQGMVSFAKVLKPQDTQAIRAYIISEANSAYAEEHAGAARGAGK